MRPFILVLILAALGLGALTYATFQTTQMLAPLPTAGRGAVFAAFIGAGLLFGLFVFLQRKSRKNDRDRKR